MNMQCHCCHAPLASVRYVFAIQRHHLEYEQQDEVTEAQAMLYTSELTTLERYCSSACCKQELAVQLEKLGLPPQLQHNRILGGPICPCGKCGKPVDMTKPHVAVVKGKVQSDSEGNEDVPDWLDMLTVLCANCFGLPQQAWLTSLQQEDRKISARMEQPPQS